ncbi:MAG: SNF2-related protein, partial [Candidatus Bipolaricaulaceae bacterium]
MAGLLLKELKYRGMLERILIVTPANLTDQWRRELKEKFGETFEVMNRNTATALYQENPWARRTQLITSLDFAKREENLRQLEQAHWDLVIVDEAHKLSASRYGLEVKKSQRYRLGEVLSQKSHHLLFLTATPHQGDDEQFRLLLDLLEPDLFAHTILLEEAARA